MKKFIIAFLITFIMLTLSGCQALTLEDLGFNSHFQEDLGTELEKHGFTSSYQQEIDERLKSGNWKDLEVDEISKEIDKQSNTTKKTKKTVVKKKRVVINGEVTSEQAEDIYEEYGLEVDPSKVKSDESTQDTDENTESEIAEEYSKED